MLNQRRKLLQYFRRKDFEGYSVLLVRLVLKDSFAKQVTAESIARSVSLALAKTYRL